MCVCRLSALALADLEALCLGEGEDGGVAGDIASSVADLLARDAGNELVDVGLGVGLGGSHAGNEVGLCLGLLVGAHTERAGVACLLAESLCEAGRGGRAGYFAGRLADGKGSAAESTAGTLGHHGGGVGSREGGGDDNGDNGELHVGGWVGWLVGLDKVFKC